MTNATLIMVALGFVGLIALEAERVLGNSLVPKRQPVRTNR